jgi:hypothetical protein
MAKTVTSSRLAANESTKFTIKPADLAKGLGIKIEKLYKIVEFFDSDSNDEWDLKENEHFMWLSKNQGTRIFSEQGAYAIALYLDKNEKKSVLAWCKEFLFKHQQKLQQSFIRKKVLDNSTSLIRQNNYHYLSRKDTVTILSTSYPRLNQAFKEIQKTETLIYGTEFIEIDGVNYYSLSAFERLSQNLGNNLKSENRRAWCNEVSCTGFRTLKLLADEQDNFEQRIAVVKRQARTRDRDRCQITEQKSTPARPIDIAVHHIYCRNTYPVGADRIDNLITLSQEVHKEFHNWHGGNDKPCTIHDLIRFASEQYPGREKVSLDLNKIKHKLVYLDANLN